MDVQRSRLSLLSGQTTLSVPGGLTMVKTTGVAETDNAAPPSVVADTISMAISSSSSKGLLSSSTLNTSSQFSIAVERIVIVRVGGDMISKS